MEEFHTFETQCQLKGSLTVDTAQHHLSAVLMASCLAAALLPLLPASRPLCVAHISCSAPDPITITPARGGNVSLLRRDIARQWAIRDNFSEAQARPRANIGLYDYALPPPSPGIRLLFISTYALAQCPCKPNLGESGSRLKVRP